MTEHEEEIQKLLDAQPDATDLRIGIGACPCRAKGTLLSYRFVGEEQRIRVRGKPPHEVEYQDCGFYCVDCGWGNGGGRPVDPANDDMKPISGW